MKRADQHAQMMSIRRLIAMTRRETRSERLAMAPTRKARAAAGQPWKATL
jgi:hypothetical protein